VVPSPQSIPFQVFTTAFGFLTTVTLLTHTLFLCFALNLADSLVLTYILNTPKRTYFK
jgi:hypothetical protein